MKSIREWGRRRFGVGLMALTLLCGLPATSVWGKEISIGVVSNGLIVDSIYVAADLAAKEGLQVRVVEFSDWVMPNTAVLNGDIDINYFQHEPFLQSAEQAGGYDLVPLGYGIDSLIGIYSRKVKTFDAIASGSRIGIADDPVNQGRGLQLLQDAGLIRLKEDIGFKASLHDITENPKQLSFVELPGPQLPRAIDDLTAILSYPHYIKSSGVMDPAAAMLFSQDATHTFALRFVVHPNQVANADIRRFIRIYQDSPEVKKSLSDSYGNASLYKLAWESFPPLEVQP